MSQYAPAALCAAALFAVSSPAIADCIGGDKVMAEAARLQELLAQLKAGHCELISTIERMNTKQRADVLRMKSATCHITQSPLPPKGAFYDSMDGGSHLAYYHDYCQDRTKKTQGGSASNCDGGITTSRSVDGERNCLTINNQCGIEVTAHVTRSDHMRGETHRVGANPTTICSYNSTFRYDLQSVSR